MSLGSNKRLLKGFCACVEKKFILIVVLTIYDIMWISRYSHDRNAFALFFHVLSIWHWTENVRYLTFGCWIYYHTKHPLNLQMYVWNYVITSIRIFPGLLPWLHPIIDYICTNTLLLFMRFLFLQMMHGSNFKLIWF